MLYLSVDTISLLNSARVIRKGIEWLAFEASLRHVLVEDSAMYALCSYSPHLAEHFKMRIKKKCVLLFWFWEAWVETFGGAATY